MGTILAIINHYDSLFSRSLTSTNFFQISLTYLVPYSVATFGTAMQGRHLELKRLKKINKARKHKEKFLARLHRQDRKPRVINLILISAIAAFVLLEKVAPGGRLVSRVAGILFMVWRY